jgi:phenylacetate-CoA ligase
MNRSKITFFLLGKKYGFNLNKMLKFVNENQYWDKERIYDYQLAQLKKLIKHIYTSVPYYCNVMKEIGMQPGDFKEIKDLKAFPVITKQVIRDNFELFLAKDYETYHPMQRSTGGTTGIPFKYYIDAYSWCLNWATKIRTFSWGNYNYGRDKIAVLKGGSMLRQGDYSPKTYLWNYLNNYYTIPIMNMTSETMDIHFEQVKKKRINFMRGYPSSIYTFANYLKSKSIFYNMEGIFTTAEMLYPYQRNVIEDVLGTRIIDAYGCGDGMAGANQCEQKNKYHINIETSYMEILSSDYKTDAQPGEEGIIVVTSLNDYAMPFIRYAPGDMAIQGKGACLCGRGLPVLEKIIGRSSDLFELANGRVLNGLSIPFEEWADKIEKFQLIQEEPDLIVLKLIPKDIYTEKDETQIMDLLKFNAGEGIKIQIEKVKNLESTSAGKFKYVISKVNK